MLYVCMESSAHSTEPHRALPFAILKFISLQTSPGKKHIASTAQSALKLLSKGCPASQGMGWCWVAQL